MRETKRHAAGLAAGRQMGGRRIVGGRDASGAGRAQREMDRLVEKRGAKALPQQRAAEEGLKHDGIGRDERDP